MFVVCKKKLFKGFIWIFKIPKRSELILVLYVWILERFIWKMSLLYRFLITTSSQSSHSTLTQELKKITRILFKKIIWNTFIFIFQWKINNFSLQRGIFFNYRRNTIKLTDLQHSKDSLTYCLTQIYFSL